LPFKFIPKEIFLTEENTDGLLFDIELKTKDDEELPTFYLDDYVPNLNTF